MFATATRRAHCLSLITASVVPERRRAVAGSTLVLARKTFRRCAAIRAAGFNAFSVATHCDRLHVACTMRSVRDAPHGSTIACVIFHVMPLRGFL